jgi:hypothetical protein
MNLNPRPSCWIGVFVLALAGCAGDRPPPDPKPGALSAARERARQDFGCEKTTAEVLSEKLPKDSVYAIDRFEYQVDVRGCGKRITYTVACTRNSVCSALAERSVIERTQ